MKKLIVSVAAIAVALVILPLTVYADSYYVIRDRHGDMAVTNGRPVYGWFTQSGPYPSFDAAVRASGTGMGYPVGGYYDRLGSGVQDLQYPQVVPRKPGQVPEAYLIP